MRSERKREAGAWLVTILVSAAAAWVWMDSSADSLEPLAPPAEPPHRLVTIDRVTLAATRAILDERNPFRVDRSHPTVRWGSIPEDIGEPSEEVPVAPRPSLELGGVIGGPPWLVLIEGFPGREEGVLMQENDDVDGIRFAEIRADTVVLTSADTTWRLIPKKLWR